jgi:hypothetical protein
MFDGAKYGIAEINFNDENYSKYIKFKEVFSKIMLEENKNLIQLNRNHI